MGGPISLFKLILAPLISLFTFNRHPRFARGARVGRLSLCSRALPQPRLVCVLGVGAGDALEEGGLGHKRLCTNNGPIRFSEL